MIIEITGIQIDPELRARVTTTLTEAVAPLHVEPISAKAVFFDEDGPRHGPAIRCALIVRLPRRRILRVEHTDLSARLAFDVAYDVLGRRLHEAQARLRDLRRRPKKYFAAKHLLATT